MKKALTALAAVAVLGAATVATPTPAAAFFWVIPAIIGAGAIGLGVGAATSPPPPPPPPRVAYYSDEPVAQPRAPAPHICHIARERTPEGTKRVRVCD